MNFHKIDTCNMNNGEGIRCVLWVSGCSHHCPNCFNQETWDPKSGKPIDMDAINLIESALSEKWCKGITMTGGDPLFEDNRAEMADLCERLKKTYPNKTIWIYTGYTLEYLRKMNDDNINRILNCIDVLCDGVFIEQLKSPDKPWVGSSNQKVWRKNEQGIFTEFF